MPKTIKRAKKKTKANKVRKSNPVICNYSLPPTLQNLVRKIAKKKECYQSDIVRGALIKYLKVECKKQGVPFPKSLEG